MSRKITVDHVRGNSDYQNVFSADTFKVQDGVLIIIRLAGGVQIPIAAYPPGTWECVLVGDKEQDCGN